MNTKSSGSTLLGGSGRLSMEVDNPYNPEVIRVITIINLLVNSC